MRRFAVLSALLLACSSSPGGFGGLGADVEIIVDELGVPHIYGSSDADVFYASGYQMATDRLFQMDLVRRRALGRRGEVLGVGLFDDDRIARLFDWTGLGRADGDRLRSERPETWAAVEAWVAGVNRRIAEVNAGDVPLPWGFGPDELDYRPEPWDVRDPLIIGKMIYFANENLLEHKLFLTLLKNLQPEAFAAIDLLTPMYADFTVPRDEGQPRPWTPGEAGAPQGAAAAAEDVVATLRALHRLFGELRVVGSNNWALAGAHTANGRPLIANDPHQPIESPNLMYAQHLSSLDGGGTLDVIGFGFVGTPGVQLGHNRQLAWTATTSFGDTMDVWEVDDLGLNVKIGDAIVPVAVRREAIVLRGEGLPAGQGDTLEVVVVDVPGHGVLLPNDLAPVPIAASGRALLFRWQGAEPREPREMLDWDRSATLDEFEAAVEMLGQGFNFVAADATGITYRVGQAIPDRGDLTGRPAPWLVMDGSDARTLWTGATLPAEKLPQLRDPARGWIATANNDPFGFTADGSVDGDAWYYGALFDPGFRAHRITGEIERLVARGDITVEDMAALQTDVHSPLADELVPLVVDVAGRIDSDDALAEFRGRADLAGLAALLAGWDKRMARDASAAVVFHAWIHLLAERVLADELGPFFGTALDLADVFVLKVTARTVLEHYAGADAIMPEGRDRLVLLALADTADWLAARFGAWDPAVAGYTFGDVHGTAFVGPYASAHDLPFVASDGGEDTINVSASKFLDDDTGGPGDQWAGHDGPIFRMIAGFAEDGTPEARVAFAGGLSGEPASAHFNDLLDDWVDGNYRPLPFRRADVEAAMESRSVLPKGMK